MQVTIPNGAAVSEMIATQGAAIVGLLMPAAWTAAALGYKACLSGHAADLKTVKDQATGTLLQTLVVADDWIAFPLTNAIFAPFIQLASVTAATTTGVNQGAARDITLLLKPNFLS